MNYFNKNNLLIFKHFFFFFLTSGSRQQGVREYTQEIKTPSESICLTAHAQIHCATTCQGEAVAHHGQLPSSIIMTGQSCPPACSFTESQNGLVWKRPQQSYSSNLPARGGLGTPPIRSGCPGPHLTWP